MVRTSASHTSHPTAKKLLTGVLPFLSLPGLLLCHCCVELLKSGGERLPFSGITDLGQALRERAEAPSAGQEITCQEPLPAEHPTMIGQRRGHASLCPLGSICFTPRTTAWLAGPALALGRPWLLPSHAHTNTCVCTHAHTCSGHWAAFPS